MDALDRWFRITERGSDVRTELRGGLATFFTMAYIVVLNPIILSGVVDGSGQTVGGAFVRLLDSSDEFTAEVVASATGDFRFFAAPGTWTLRALSPAGNGDASVAPSGAGIHEVDVKVA